MEFVVLPRDWECWGHVDQGWEWKSCLGHILPERQVKHPSGNAKQEAGYLSLEPGWELKQVHSYKLGSLYLCVKGAGPVPEP